MSDLRIEIDTQHQSMDEARAGLDAALKAEFPGGMLQRKWDGDVLRLSGPGADGAITHQNGQLVGVASLTPPASMMKPMIEKKITAAMQKAAAG